MAIPATHKRGWICHRLAWISPIYKVPILNVFSQNRRSLKATQSKRTVSFDLFSNNPNTEQMYCIALAAQCDGNQLNCVSHDSLRQPVTITVRMTNYVFGWNMFFCLITCSANTLIPLSVTGTRFYRWIFFENFNLNARILIDFRSGEKFLVDSKQLSVRGKCQLENIFNMAADCWSSLPALDGRWRIFFEFEFLGFGWSFGDSQNYLGFSSLPWSEFDESAPIPPNPTNGQGSMIHQPSSPTNNLHQFPPTINHFRRNSDKNSSSSIIIHILLYFT